MIKCFHKAADSKFDDAYTRILYYLLYSYPILKDDRFLDTFFLFLGEK